MALICERCGCGTKERKRCADKILARAGFRSDGIHAVLPIKEERQQIRFEAGLKKIPFFDPESQEARLTYVIPASLEGEDDETVELVFS
jgi:hypothetical protein